MDFKELSVPQAVAVSMQAATKTVTYTEDGRNAYDVHLKTDNDRLIELSEKLEGRIQDELELAAKANQPAEDAPDEDVENVSWSEIVLMEDGSFLNLKGAIYQKACNEPVLNDDDLGDHTFCIKRWGHRSPQHEDQDGITTVVRGW